MKRENIKPNAIIKETFVTYQEYKLYNTRKKGLMLKCNNLLEKKENIPVNSKRLFSDAVKYGKMLYDELKEYIEPLEYNETLRHYINEENITIILKRKPKANEKIKDIIAEWSNKYGTPYYSQNKITSSNLFLNHFSHGNIEIYRFLDLLIFSYLCFQTFNLKEENILFKVYNQKEVQQEHEKLEKKYIKIESYLKKSNVSLNLPDMNNISLRVYRTINNYQMIHKSLEYKVLFKYDKKNNKFSMKLEFEDILSVVWYELKIFLCSITDEFDENGNFININYKTCANQECNKPFIPHAGKQIYCEECSEIMENQKYMRYYHKKKELWKEVIQLYNKNKNKDIPNQISIRIKEIITFNASQIKKLKITELNEIKEALEKSQQ